MVKLTKLIDLLEDILLTDLNDSYLSQWIELNRKDITTTRVALIVDKIDTLVCSDKALDEKKCLLETYKKELEHININIDIQKLIYEIKSIIEHKSETNIINNIIIHIANMSKNSEYKDDIIKIKKELSELNDNNKLAKLKYIDQLNKDLLEKFLHNEYGKKIAKNQNVGLELIDLLNEYRLSESLFEIVEDYVIDILTGKTIYKYKIKPLIFMALALIIIEEYSREGLYDRLPEKFNYLYDNFSKTKVDQIFRDASQYNSYKNDTDNCRLVTSVTANILVPRKYLVGFFEFIYDIYKYNFRFAIPENLEEDFHAIYASLKSKMLGIKDQIDTNIESGKSYKLLRGTQLIIKQERDIDSLIALSCLITKVIHLHFWTEENFLKNTYINYGLNQWKDKHKDRIRKDKENNKDRKPYSKHPEFVYKLGYIRLLPKEQNIMCDDDFSDIEVVITNGDQVIERFTQPIIEDIIGGYKVYIDGHIILSNPLGELKYEIISKDKVLYSSKTSLYRSSIVFKADGSEFKNMTDYAGTIHVCSLKNNKSQISSREVKIGEQLNIGGNIYYFENLPEATIYGDKLYNHYIKDLESEELYPVYKSIHTLYFSTTEESDRINIVINGKNNHISKFKSTLEKDGPYLKYAIKMDSLISGIYNIKIIDLLNEDRCKEYHFAIDKKLAIPHTIYPNYNMKISVQSELAPSTEYKISLCDFTIDWLKFHREGHSYGYIIPLDIPMCRINSGKWELVSKAEFWVPDIEPYTILDFYNASQDSIQVISENGIVKGSSPLRRKKLISSSEIYFLKNYKDFSTLVIQAPYTNKRRIYCYYHCVVNKRATEFIALDNNTLKILPSYKGKGEMRCTLSLHGENIATKIIHNGEAILFENIRSLVSYRIKFVEVIYDFFDETLIPRFSSEFFHFFKNDLVNQMLPIVKVFYEVYFRNKRKWIEIPISIRGYFINFIQRIDNGWIGEIYLKEHGIMRKLKNIGEIYIEEVPQKYTDRMFYVYVVSHTQDGLLYDGKNKIIVDGLENKTARDITKFLIKIEG